MRFWIALLAVTALVPSAVMSAAASADPLLVVLRETGSEREGLPVYERHPDAAAVEDALSRGFSGRLLRLYREMREEPAYLLLSGNQGGFPRFGFVLDDRIRPEAGYVDLHRDSDLAGAPGALDQIFPHELLHVMVRQLGGPRRDGRSNQVHAVGVRTDPETAFEEGFAEHAQVMALDDPDALPETRAMAADVDLRAWAETKVDAYARAIAARFSFGTKARVTFPLWFGRSEQILRYHGVRENLFARERPLPARLSSGRDPYATYLFENIVPGRNDDPRKPLRRCLSTEGVVSALFVGWLKDPDILAGGPAGRGLENAYRRLFEAIRRGKPATTAELLRSYAEAFPEDRPALLRVVGEVLGPEGPSLLDPPAEMVPEIWLRNRELQTGTTMYDQFRGLPRDHTFDLNAASPGDLLSVPGLDRTIVRAILDAGPFSRVADLETVPGLDAGTARRMVAMALAANTTDITALEQDTVLQLDRILLPFVWRALVVLGFAVLLGAVAYRLVRRTPWWRALTAGLGASLVVLPAAWILAADGSLVPLVLPALAFGLAGAAWSARRRPRWGPALQVVAAWLAAALPAFLFTRPWF